MKKIIIYLHLFSSLSACAIKEPFIPLIPQKIEFLGHEVKECDSTQRDLSIPWTLRQYWCSNKNKVKNLQKINNHILEISMTDKEYVNAINDATEKKVEKKSVKLKSLQEIIYSDIKADASKKDKKTIRNYQSAVVHKQKKFTNSNQKVNQSAQVKIETVIPNSTVLFAKNIRVLGPQGRRETIALIPKVNLANKVYLRGLLLPEEVLVNSDLYKEKVSVGRALAVRKLWVQNGVDINDIKILHHNSDLVGRSVEVYFNG